ncbi:MAG: tRNA preQ1(34) S-adenosylmethionine ribosyltransferase-isomerase QueA [Sphaerochaetaceae bacterium]|nr:tRNA preQ1(34) S-adenosylmethionine ribosyltransferase-isomerase QueA [Sphaerochaetaceae bacterium]
MKISEFTFDLPQELIAQTPAQRRGDDRLLVIDRKTGEYQDLQMKDFPSLIEEGSVLVVNDTKVRKARVFGISETGGKVEFLFTGAVGPDKWQAMVSKSKRQKPGKTYDFLTPDGNLYCKAMIDTDVQDNDQGSSLKVIKFDREIDESFFQICGHVPLPPYIKREDDFSDESRYQTIFANECGSMAAPTAGLHFTPEIIAQLEAKNVEVLHVTLHVGMGTFLPVRTENLEDHVMHTESYYVSNDVADKINKAKALGKKIVAVGTTSVRTLESAVNRNTGLLEAKTSSTNLFIKPGFEFAIVDQMMTNFHTPESTLLVLVSAFAGKEHILNAYKHAVENRYRFFSYGDATFLM